MPYPYGTQNAPAVGNGLGGLPRRASASTPSAPVVPAYQDFAVVLVATSPFIHVYKRVADTLVAVSSADHGITLSYAASYAMFSPGGRYLAIGIYTGTKRVVRIWKCDKGVFTFLRDIDESWVYSLYYLNFSADERFFAIGTNESDGVKNVVAYTIDTATDTFTRTANLTNQQSGAISSPAFSSTGTYLAVSYQSNGGTTIYKWNGTSYSYLTIVDSGGNAQHPAFSSDDSFLIVSTPGQSYKFKTYSRSGDTFTFSTTYETQSPLDAFQLNVRNNYMPWYNKAYLTFSASSTAATSATSYNDPNTACPNADASYIFSGGYYSQTLRLAKRTGLSTLTGVAETGILPGSNSGPASTANRVTAATVRIN